METIISEKTKTTPKVVYNQYSGEILIKGKSIPFDSDLFWSMVIHQIKNLKDKVIKIKIDLHYINTNSIIYIYKLLKTNPKI